ncbi:ATP-binding protein [Falsiroseomonas sp. HW251]|uniref:ATP-binding protein n=1 Tax=Falsiroseomonas sp. HW251 TaxID=3390998 RepID=UPI003D31A6BE
MRPDAPTLTRDVPLDIAAVEAAQDEIAAFLEERGVPPAACYKLRLIVEELLANLIMHGRFDGAPPPAKVSVEITPDALLLTIEDASAPYDPREAPEPAAPSLDDDKVGGLGLSLVRRMAEIRSYQRLPEGWNRCEMALPLGDAPAG